MKPETPYDEPLREDQTIVCSTSGGKDSTALALYLLKEAGLPNPLRFVFADTGWEHLETYKYLDTLEKHLGVTIDRVKGEYDFVSICEKKGRFPSALARFCTEELKVKPLTKYIDAVIEADEDPVVAVGIRAEESPKRALMSEWAYSGVYDAPMWRPLIKWSAEEVFALHKKHGVPPNPLYLRGAGRVGCWPCIMARKAEFTNGFLAEDGMLQKLVEAEERVGVASRYGVATFRSHDKVPKKFHDKEYTTDDGRHYTLPSALALRNWAIDGNEPDPDAGSEPPTCFSQYGLCE